MVRPIVAILVFFVACATAAPVFGSVTGNVVDANLKAVKDARVDLVDVLSGKTVAVVTSDAKGKFLFPGLRPGNYALVVTSNQACAIFSPIHITAGILLVERLQIKNRETCSSQVRFTSRR